MILPDTRQRTCREKKKRKGSTQARWIVQSGTVGTVGTTERENAAFLCRFVLVFSILLLLRISISIIMSVVVSEKKYVHRYTIQSKTVQACPTPL